MKTIAELQQEIRSIRKGIKNMDVRLDAMDTELSNYKDTTSGNSEYERIFRIAETLPVIKHPIVKAPMNVKNNYFSILLMIALADDSLNENQLLFLQRMVISDASYQHLEHYIASLGSIIPENVLYKLDENISGKYVKQLILDMLILANLCHGNTKKSYELIVSIASVFTVNKKGMQRIANVASAILKQDCNNIDSHYLDVINIDKTYGYYLIELSGWEEKVKKALVEETVKPASNSKNKSENGMILFRQVVIELPDVEAKSFKWKVKQGQKVKKDEVIARYNKATKSRGFTHATNYKAEEIVAPCAGTIFQFRDNYINYGVLAHETDNKDSIKAWVKARR